MQLKKCFVQGYAVLALLGLCALARPAAAASHACADDIKKFCSDVDASDKKAVHACLESHSADVSDACKAKMKSHMKKKAAAPSADQGGSNTNAMGAPDASSAPTNPAQ